MIIDYQKVHILRKFIIFPHLHSFRHENTKDKREANPESWDLSDELEHGEPRRVHAKYVQLFFLVCSSLNFEFILQNFRKELQ